MNNSEVTIHCDGLSAIQLIEKSPEDSFTVKKNFDIINSIIALKKLLPLRIKLAHIKGHQDMGTAYQSLPKLAQLNVIADDPAKSKALSLINNNINLTLDNLPYSPCDIFIKTQVEGTQKISNDLINTLRIFITRDELRTYWIDKKELHNVYHKVDWNLRDKSISNQSRNQQQWLRKHTTAFCGSEPC